MGSLKAVILAAGEGIRLRPFTMSRPKAMIPIGNKPVLEHIVHSLVANGISDIVIVVGYFENTIMSHFGDGRNFGAKITYVSQSRPIGTAHAVFSAWDILKDEDKVIVLAGDNFIDKNTVASALNGEPPLAVVTESVMPSKYGVVSLKDSRITSIVEKPETNFSNIISTGIYLFDKQTLNFFSSASEVSALGISEVLSSHLHQICLSAVKTDGGWVDAVYPQDLVKLNDMALENVSSLTQGTIEHGVTLKGNVHIGEGSRIRSGCYIEGPVIIGENCDIGPDVTISAFTSIGNDVQIGPYSCIAGSVLMDNIAVGTHCHISRSAVDCGVEIGSAVLADGVARGRDRSGVMIGQDSWIGSGTVFFPNDIVGSECRISSGSTVRSSLENRSIVV